MKKRNWIKHRPLFASPVPTEVRRPGIRWNPLLMIWQAVRRLCLLIGGLVLILALIVMYFAGQVAEPVKTTLPAKMALYLPLEGDLEEIPAEPSLTQPLAEVQPSVHELVDMIDHATVDKRVQGIVAEMGSGDFSMARTSELRAAIKRFKAAGKFTYIYSTSYGEGPGGLGRYYVASAFDQVWMQPMGLVSIPGVRAEVPFFRDTLDKIGIQPQFYKRKEYKTAYESATNQHISAPNKEELTAVIDDIRKQILSEIPSDRKMSPEAFEALVQRGLFTAPEAVQAKLVTKLDYADALMSKIKKDLTGDPDADDDSVFVQPRQYMASYNRKSDEDVVLSEFRPVKPAVALIYVVGAIFDTDIGGNPIVGDKIAAADEIAPAIMDAADDPSIQAIVIRIDSPGGSPAASETILRSIEKAKQKGKPVIVSMGTMAASGGYWVASYADKIFAMPTTLTGSIGVLGGKLSVGGLWDKLGVNWDKSIQWGDNAGIWSMNTPFSPKEEERINAMLDNVYDSFIARVAKGRGMTPAQVDKIAGGRVWTGMRAIKIGLVDEIGGLRETLNYTAQILGAKDKSQIDVVVMPKPLTPMEQLKALLSGQTGVFAGNKLNAQIAALIQPLSQELALLKSGGYAAYEPLRIQN